ncbi:MAG: type II secretion system protein [Candidatus Paceibacterota bacterium]|jgi:prepilin-type N-terminal cleavage/methylation domain-containing protein
MNTISEKKGFTLLELLIVVAIIAALSAILIIVINPAETLAQSRDSQRIADLSTMKTAMGFYLTSLSSPYIGATSSNLGCIDSAVTANRKIWLSVPLTTPVTDATPPATTWTAATSTWVQSATLATAAAIDGTGWIPVNFGALTGGSPISNLPIDPTNTVTAAGVTSTDYMYRYACKGTPISYEIDANLESIQYTSTDNKETKDGGNNTLLLEVGTDLSILPSTSDF